MTTKLAPMIIEPAASAPVTLFGTDDPTAVVERASNVATALASVIDERRLFSNIGGKKHVQVEGWTLLGSMLGVFAEIEWSRPLDNGWEARAVARTLNGNVVGAAEAMCTTSEGRWGRADAYAVRSMAQTRAVSKALRMPLGFIMHLAGYSATPAEEMTDTTPPREPSLREQIADELGSRGLGLADLERLADLEGVPKGTQASDAQLRAILARIQQPVQDERQPTPGGAPSENAATTPEPATQPSEGGSSPDGAGSESATVSPPDEPAPTDPPIPGTDAYKALPPLERAAARAFWDARIEPEPEQSSLAEQLGAPEVVV